MTPALFHLVAGPTGAGKTTFALRLADELGAVRFSIDEWMATLFWADAPETLSFDWAIERVTRCEAQIAELATALVRRGVPVVLDLGFTTQPHREKFVRIGREAGVGVEVHVVDAPAEERWRRVEQRNRNRGETYQLEVTREMFDFMEKMWEPPEP